MLTKILVACASGTCGKDVSCKVCSCEPAGRLHVTDIASHEVFSSQPLCALALHHLAETCKKNPNYIKVVETY